MICLNGKLHLNKPLHKHQVLPLSWDIMGFFGVTLVTKLTALSIHVCILLSFCNYLFIMMLDSFLNARGMDMHGILACLIHQYSINYIQGEISVLLNLWWWEDLFYLHWKILTEVHLSLRKHFGFLKHSVRSYAEIMMKSVLFQLGSFCVYFILFLFCRFVISGHSEFKLSCSNALAVLVSDY